MTAPRVTRVMGGLAVLCLSLAGSTASAQSLADIAKKAGNQPRAAAGRVLTNHDLPPNDEVASAPATAPVPEPASSSSSSTSAIAAEKAVAASQPAGASERAKARDKRTEAVWRSEAQGLRDRLARVVADSAELATRLDALDAGPSTTATFQERALVASTLNRMRANETSLREQLTQFEARAQADKVPADWLR